MSITDLKDTYQKAKHAFKEILPPQSKVDEWHRLLPLDVILIANNERIFEEFKSKWERFLERLDQLWNRLNAFAKHHIIDQKTKSAVKGYLGNINSQRINDELLVYLDKARNSAHHTLWRHIRPAEAYEVVTDASGVQINFFTNKLTIRSNGGGTVSEIVVLKEGAILLKEVEVVEKVGKATYFLPEIHHGVALHPIERVLPQMVGKKGLIFYKDVLNSVIKKIENGRHFTV